MTHSFTCYGHENITSKHKTTLEFTKDKELDLKGDCIIGIRADFSLKGIKKFIKSLGNNKEVTIVIETINNNFKNENKIKNNKNKTNNEDKNIIEKINCEINPDFNSDNEMIIRKSDFISERTFAIRADKAACEVNRSLMTFLKENDSKIMVIFKAKHNI